VNVFIDSNVLLYAMGQEPHKRARARTLLVATPWISTQVLNECSHVLRRKHGWSPTRVADELERLLPLMRVADLGLAETREAWRLAAQLGYSHFDCLIIAAALAVCCTRLYTEDMQHGQRIDRRLQLINPFLAEQVP